MSLIQVRDLQKHYREGAQKLTILRSISLDIHAGEIVSLVGRSGCGKSTLLHLLGLLDHPDGGSIQFEQQELTSLNEKKKTAIRRKDFGFVFQFHHLLPEFTALENVEIPLYLMGKNKTEARQRAEYLLQDVALQDRMHHYPAELSGGEQQRVAIARALANQPKIIFADEPSGNLDEHSSENIENLIWKLNREFQQTFFIATHNLALARKAHRMLRLHEGEINEEKPNSIRD